MVTSGSCDILSAQLKIGVEIWMAYRRKLVGLLYSTHNVYLDIACSLLTFFLELIPDDELLEREVTEYVGMRRGCGM